MEPRNFAKRELVEVVLGVEIVEEAANLLGTLDELSASPSFKLSTPKEPQRHQAGGLCYKCHPMIHCLQPPGAEAQGARRHLE
jgi:hypothetical protein